MVAPLLATKLYIPPLRRSLVRRPRLLEHLDQGLRRKLTLVSAPAGFGKTTLVAEWVRDLEEGHSPEVKVAWVSLDSGDDDPARFFAYLSAAVERAGAGLWQDNGETLEPAGLVAFESPLVELINRVAVWPVSILLVLDDYHLISSQVVHDAVAFMVDHLSENMHLVMATRGDPPLPLARLRARGELTELRQADLRFTAEETTVFLNEVARLGLPPEEVGALEARTEGWIAGLRMASLAAQGRQAGGAKDLSGFVQAFTGSHRFVLDYLMEEVLSQQPPHIQEFLLKTSILQRLTGPLCDAVRFGPSMLPPKLNAHGDEAGEQLPGPRLEAEHQSPGQRILESLENDNLFIVPLDDERRWYRYHRLFSDLLRKRMRQAYGELEPELHRRASEWHEQQGLVAAAIEHALVAEDHERAVTLIEENAEATFTRSEVMTYLRWVEKLPEDLVRSHPTVCFYHAWALLMSGRSSDDVEQRLKDIEYAEEDGAGSAVMAGRLAALRAYGMLFRPDLQEAEELGRVALENLPEGDLFLRSVVAWILSLARLSDGSLEDGSRAFDEVARMGQDLGNPLVTVTALCHKAKLQMRQGLLYQARETLERALDLATDRQGRRLPIASEALIGLGELWREWNDLDTAERYLTEGIERAMRWSEMSAFDAYGPLAYVKMAQGDVEGARETIEVARKLASRSEATRVDDHVAELLLGRFTVVQRDVEGAKRWLGGRDRVPKIPEMPDAARSCPEAVIKDHLRKYETGVEVRVLILQDRAAEALDLLEPQMAEVVQLGRVDLIIEAHILQALAFQAAGEEERAVTALEEALRLAEPGGYVRTFLDEGQVVAQLLRRAAPRSTRPAYVARLLAGFDDENWAESQAGSLGLSPQPLVEPLSEREVEVLRLLARGMSNPEIAESLYIAVSTVRSHCKSIYAKLDVHKRWDAVQRAQELGLI